MSQIVIPDSSKQTILSMLLLGGRSPFNGHSTCHLYGNTPTVDFSTSLGDFEELVLLGYEPWTLNGPVDFSLFFDQFDTWTWPPTIITAASTPSSPATANGYWVTGNDDGALLWCQQFDTPLTWVLAGDAFSVTPVLSLGQLT